MKSTHRKFGISLALLGFSMGVLTACKVLSGSGGTPFGSVDVGAGPVDIDDGDDGGSGGGGGGYDPGATNLSFGAQSLFNTSRAYDLMSIRMSDTRQVIVFRDMAGGGRLHAVVADLSGTAVNLGPKQALDDDCTGCLMASAAALTATRFAVAYPDTNDSSKGVARTCDVSGATITCNAKAAYTDSDVSIGKTAVARLADDQFAVSYFDAGTAGKANVATVAGDGSLAYGAAATFETGMMMVYQASAGLSSSQFAIAFEDGTDMHGKAVVGTVSGTSIAFSNAFEFNAAPTALGLAITSLSPSKIAIAYVKQNQSGYAIVGTVGGAGAGAAIAYGSEAMFTDNMEQDVSISAMAADKFVVGYVNNNLFGYGGTAAAAAIGKVSANAITYGFGYGFLSYSFAKPVYPAVSAFTDDGFLAVVNSNEVNKGAAYAGTVSAGP